MRTWWVRRPMGVAVAVPIHPATRATERVREGWAALREALRRLREELVTRRRGRGQAA